MQFFVSTLVYRRFLPQPMAQNKCRTGPWTTRRNPSAWLRQRFIHHAGALFNLFGIDQRRDVIVRFIVLGFAVLACLKVWIQDRIYRASVGDVVVQAYRDRAEQACRKEFIKSNITPAAAWPAHFGGEVTIGNSSANVALWDFDNPLWNVKFRHPNLVLSGNDTASPSCNYDLVAGIATLAGR